MDKVPVFWLWCAGVGIVAALVATAYVVVTEYPPLARLVKSVEIRLLVWKGNHSSRFTSGQEKRFRYFLGRGDIAVVDTANGFPLPGEPWFYIPRASRVK